MTDNGIRVLVISSTVYNAIPSEPTVIVVPVFDTEPDTGFGVDLGDDDWAAPGLVTSLRKARLSEHRRQIDVQALGAVTQPRRHAVIPRTPRRSAVRRPLGRASLRPSAHSLP